MQPYLESLPSYTDGAPPWAPTNMGHVITSRPLKHYPEKSHLETPRNYALTRTISKINQQRNTHHAYNLRSTFINHSHSYPPVESISSHSSWSTITDLYHHHNHVPLVPTISFKFHTHLIPKSYIQFNIYKFPCPLEVSYFN